MLLWGIRELPTLWEMPEIQAASYRIVTFLEARKEKKGRVNSIWFLELSWILDTVRRQEVESGN